MNPEDTRYLIQSDAVLFGVLALILGLVFYTKQSENKILVKFYIYVPALLMCYLLPSFLTTFKLVDADASNLYYMASRYLLPAALVLLTISVDLRGIVRLGPKAGIMFLTGALGIMIGGPDRIHCHQSDVPRSLCGIGCR